ncbi:MAG: hypothetical protein GF315_06920 [candidate division Zixibacteria bacterium]|nr:hypothetical protein [candidate division Zixibacteria bacterium]
MKGIITYITALLLLVSFGSAQAAKTGEVKEDSIYIDNRLDFSVEFPEGWKLKRLKDKDDETNYQRLIATKKNFKVNQTIKRMGGEYTIPTVTIFADSTDLSIEEYSRWLIDQLYTVTSKSEIVLSTELLSDTDLLDSVMVHANKMDSKRLQFKHKYKRFLDTSGRDVNWQRDGGVKLIQDYNIIEVALYKHNDWLIMLYAVCEREFYQLNKMDFQTVFNSLRFIDETAEAESRD